MIETNKNQKPNWFNKYKKQLLSGIQSDIHTLPTCQFQIVYGNLMEVLIYRNNYFQIKNFVCGGI